jgi:membrane-anchored protein YejM (alkaline phosphatase superfamily)
MTESQARGDAGWLGAHTGVNVVSVAALSGVWVLVHEALLSGAAAGTSTDREYFQGLVMAQSLWLTMCAVLVVAVSEGAGFPRTARAVLALSFLAPAILYIDAVVREHSGVHLAELVPIALDAHANDNRRILEATGIDAARAVAFFAGLGPAVLAAGWFDAKTASLGQRLALRIVLFTRGRACVAWLLVLTVLAFLEHGASWAVHRSSWLRFERAVPQLLGALGPTPGVGASMDVAARPVSTEATIAAAIRRLEIPNEAPGDVFFFVVDSLRGDAVDPMIAPGLSSLAVESLPIDFALSGGNATHLGWYSLFWADSALGWRLAPSSESAQGPVPLQLARRRGWRIEVLSTPDLAYMNLDRTILGEGKRLADSVFDLHDQGGTSATKDAQVVEELIRRMAGPHAPTVYLAFLDSTHLPYFWGEEFAPPMSPFAGPDHYMRVQRDPSDRAAVVARYHDAVAFVDSLLTRFSRALRAFGRFDDSTVVVTGDHGEEFWEHGLAAHGSELCRVQTRVALLLKLPRVHPLDGDWTSRKPIARTMDVWPTILDASGVRGDTTALFEGVSLARDAHRTAAIAGMRYWYPSSRFVLDDGRRRALFELTRPDEPLRPQRLDVLSLLDADDTPTDLDLTPSAYEALVRERFGPDLERLFDVTW